MMIEIFPIRFMLPSHIYHDDFRISQIFIGGVPVAKSERGAAKAVDSRRAGRLYAHFRDGSK